EMSYQTNPNILVFINESFSINSQNQLNNSSLQIPVIKVLFPLIVDIEDLITRWRVGKKILKPRTKPPNTFLIYRMQYVKELAKTHRLPMRTVSFTIASSWRQEPNYVVDHYENIADQAKKRFDLNFLKPTFQKMPVSYYSRRRTIKKHIIPTTFYSFYSNDFFVSHNYQMLTYNP
ncbi:2994_t:CDS:1, partial [Racocetra persica]